MTLPDCMMPDGAEPCKAFQELEAELAKKSEPTALANSGIKETKDWKTDARKSSNRQLTAPVPD